MQKFYCNGKKGYCERRDEGKIFSLCDGCEYFNDKGGYEVAEAEKVTQLDRLKSMSADQFADFLEEVKNCCYNFGRFGIEACEECPLKEACELETDSPIADWLECEVK